MNEIAFNFYTFVYCEYLASILIVFTVTDKFILQHFVHLGLKGHVRVILKLLLVHILPKLKVANLYAIKRESHLEVICYIIGHLTILPSFEIWRLDESSNAFKNDIDKLHV